MVVSMHRCMNIKERQLTYLNVQGRLIGDHFKVSLEACRRTEWDIKDRCFGYCAGGENDISSMVVVTVSCLRSCKVFGFIEVHSGGCQHG